MTQDIVVGVDGSANSFVAMDAAASLADRLPRARLSVVHVHEVAVAPAVALASGFSAGAEQVMEQSAVIMEDTIREVVFDHLAELPIEWTFDIAAGQPAQELLRIANEKNASVVVVGGRGHSLVGGLVLGSVAQTLVRHSPISVLVVRHPHVND
jgi:nucleotide-binding universal stress UspA family protein